MIARPFQRPRPIILCLSRDLPGTAKKNIVTQLESDLPGLTIHIDEERNMGLHLGDLQQALSIRSGWVIFVSVSTVCKLFRQYMPYLQKRPSFYTQ